MKELIKQIASGLFVELPKEANKQFNEWREIAGIKNLFAEPERPQLFIGWPNAEILINRENMPV